MNNREFITKSLRTILEMLDDRQIELPIINKDGYENMIDATSNKPVFYIVIDKIKVMYYLPVKFRWSELKKSFDEDEGTYDLIILIVKEKVSQNNLKLINDLGLNLQIFDIKELQFNISRHVLVPKHEVIRDEHEIKSLIERYSLKTKYQLPHILKTDPMSRYLGLKGGDVVRITRPSPTAGEYVAYRCCL